MAVVAVRATLALVLSGVAMLSTFGDATAQTYSAQAPKAGISAGAVDGFEVVGPGTTGGAASSSPITLTIDNQSIGFKLDSQMLLPSSWDGDYHLVIKSQDVDGNTVTKEVTVTYKPAKATLTSGSNGTVLIPAVANNFRDTNGKLPIVTAPISINGAVLSANVPLYASLAADADLPLSVNGVRVNPGESFIPLGSYNFGSTDGRLELPLSVLETGQIGTAKLLLTLDTADAPVVELTVRAWNPAIVVSAPSWTARQALDTFQATAAVPSSAPCKLTQVVGGSGSTQQAGSGANLFSQPECRLVWTNMPEGLSATASGNGVTLKGRLWQAGDQVLSYALYLRSGTNDVLVQEGAQTITATAAEGGVNFAPLKTVSSVYQAVQPVDLTLKQSVGPACDVKYEADTAQQASASGRLGCFFAWSQVPLGMEADKSSGQPRLAGSLSEIGEQTITWQASVVSPTGVQIPLSSASIPITVSVPPTPSISWDNTAKAVGDYLPIVPTGGRVGEAVVASFNAPLTVTVTKNGQPLSTDKYDLSAGSGTRSVRKRIDATAAAMWEESLYQVTASYTALPSVGASGEVRTIVVPSDNIRPAVTIDSLRALDTDAVAMTVSMFDVGNQRAAYDPLTMGRWRVRIVQNGNRQNPVALTEWTEATTGSASFDVRLPDAGGTTVSIGAEAQLISPLQGFDRTVSSVRQIALVVLRGGEIGASVVAQKLSGLSPFTAVFTASITNRLDVSAVGTVTWEVSSDGGAMWESEPIDNRNKTRFSRNFTAGSYLVRARMTNKNSGAETVTEAVEVVSFEQPSMTVSGPENVFVGYPGNYRASLTKDSTDLSAEDVVVQWSMDGGKAWSTGGADLTLNMQSPVRIPMKVRARLKSAPEDAPNAWVSVNKGVNFVQVRPPQIRIAGPQIAEWGKESYFTATVEAPYRNMDLDIAGSWLLPDGTRNQSEQVAFIPSDGDISRGNADIAYEAWFVGVNDASARGKLTRTVRVWKYIWPEFKLVARRTADYAPATVTYRLETPGFSGKLDNPVYSWTVPQGGKITDDARSNGRTIVFNDVGSYMSKVVISDSRGNSSLLSDTVELPEPPPFVLTLNQRASNSYNRAPLTLSIRPYSSGGHPLDRIANYSFLVDNVEVMASPTAGQVTLADGDHIVTVVGTSKYGKTTQASLHLAVKPNQPPACSLQTREGISGWSYYAQCLDQDGRVMSYNWTLDGEASSSHGERISVGRSGRNSPPVVTLVAIDDAGGASIPVSSQPSASTGAVSN